MIDSILPPNRTPLEKALEQTGAVRFENELAPAVSRVPQKWTGPGIDLVAHLISEAGLNILDPYVTDVFSRYNKGLRWQRKLGTEAAVFAGLGFVGHKGTLEYNPTRRRFWNGWQIALDKRPVDPEDLPKISGVAERSQPMRSFLSRIHYGYDVRALEASRGRWSGAIYSAHSGAFVDGSNPKWSLSRKHEFNHTFNKAELAPFDIWVPPGEVVTWNDVNAPWEDLDLAWIELGSGSGASIMADALINLGCYMAFFGPDGHLIGARRPKALHKVGAGSVYQVHGESVAPAKGGTKIYVEALTGFGNGVREDVAEIGLLFGATPKPDLPKAKLWLEADEMQIPFEAVARQALPLTMHEATRERVLILADFK